MVRIEKNKVVFYQFPGLSRFDHLRHGVFSRRGGYSTGFFQSLNTSLGVGDTASAVEKNRRQVSTCLQVETDKLIFARQVHGVRILAITTADAERNDNADGIIGIGDAMVTNVKNRYLTIQVADCQAVMIYDPVRHVVANIHAGWRGSIANILGRALDVMVRVFSCEPKDCVAGVSPSLGPCCAEFIHYRSEIPKALWRYGDARRYFDFWTLSRDQLSKKGILPENIFISRICTKCRQDLFYSYRGESITGRFAAVIGMTG